MEIDWSKAPDGAEYNLSGVTEPWFKKVNNTWFRYYNNTGWEVAYGSPDAWENAIIDGVLISRIGQISIKQLRSLVQQSSLQIEFHADGTIYVWDDTHEEGTRVNSLDEYVRLAEAKAAYVKLWADYIWE